MKTHLELLSSVDPGERFLAASFVWSSIIELHRGSELYARAVREIVQKLDDSDRRVQACAVHALWEHAYGTTGIDHSLVLRDVKVLDLLVSAARTCDLSCRNECFELLGLISRLQGTTLSCLLSLGLQWPSAYARFVSGAFRAKHIT